MDPRKEYIVSCVNCLCGLPTEKASETLLSSPELIKFLDDLNCRVLQVAKISSEKFGREEDEEGKGSEDEGSTTIRLSNELESVCKETCKGEVHFVKTTNEELTEKNIRKSILVLSMLGSPVSSLYQSLHSVYAPAILKDPTWASKIDHRTQDLLTELDKNLGSVVRYGDPNADRQHTKDDFSGILSPADEIEFWKDESTRGGREKKRAQVFSKCFDRIADGFSMIETITIGEFYELIEETELVLDEIWKADLFEIREAFPQDRMTHLFYLISATIIRRVQQILTRFDPWIGPFTDVRIGLQEGIRICEKWSIIISDLTGSHWRQYSDHRWENNKQDSGEEEFQDQSLMNFLHRIEDILRIRTTHEELLKLLNKGEQESLRIAETFDVFDNVQLLHCNSFTKKQWDNALIEYEKIIVPIERQIASKLASRLNRLSEEGNSRNPQVALREFQIYQRLIARPEISKILVNQRESLLSRLIAYVEEIESDFETKQAKMHNISENNEVGSNLGTPATRNMSPTLSVLVWASQLSGVLESTISTASGLLEDLQSFDRFMSLAETVESKIKSWITDVFRDWCQETEDQLEDGHLSLEMTGRLMEFNVDGILQVNYSQRLVTLLREVRQLGQLGLSVPSKIKKAASQAQKYYSYAVMLKKTANFQNNLERQIIPSQKAMLYDALVEFENEVTRPSLSNKNRKDGDSSTVTWDDPSSCKEFVQKLRVAADQLNSENRMLRKYHERLGESIVKLMDIDLLRQKQRWKSQWGDVLKLMAKLEGRYEEKRMKTWKLHWDHQAYKALEVSYKMGLESLNENLGEIRAELIFSNRKLQFRPSYEELRSTYYKEMKKFVTMPSSFKGFSSSSSSKRLFSAMIDKNSHSLVEVYKKAEKLFEKLDKLKISMEPHVILGTLNTTDLDILVESQCQNVSDYEENVKSLKAKRRDLDKLQDFYKIDCFTVNTSSLKNAIELQLQHVNDTLLICLRKRVLSTLRLVESTIDDWMEQLGRRPESIEEISQAKEEWSKISKSKSEIKLKWEDTEAFRKLLLVMASGTMSCGVDISSVMETNARLPVKWEDFEIALIAFNDMIEDQREALKQRVDEGIESCKRELNNFISRWNVAKPEEIDSWDEETTRKIQNTLQESRSQLSEVLKQADISSKSCSYFGMTAPEFEGLEEVEQEVSKAEIEWKQYDEFSIELNVLRKRDWITFRTSLFDAEDFAKKWIESMKGKARGLVLDRIAEVCNKIRKAMPALKFMRGEPFKEEHWSALVRKLGIIPRGTDLQSLTFGHFHDVIDEVNRNLQFAKDMTARAQGEVTIREAIMELKAWSETAGVEMMDHEELDRVTPLIKNWKDVLLELGDNQSLLASLKESQYYKPFEKQASVYENNMASLDEYLGMMNQIQRKWVWLEPIFGRGALPSEQSRFRRVDEDWTEIMHKLNAEPLLFNLCDEDMFPRMNETLKMMVDQLERCQKALVDFLEEKRSKLPRFYFIGDDDLLEILGQAKNPVVIQSHLKKLFQGIHTVEFDENNATIVAIKSSAGERVELETPVHVTEEVEVWLDNLSEEMRRTLKSLLVRCVHNKGQVDLDGYPSQILCLAENIKFTSRCEHAIEKGKLNALEKILRKTLQSYTSVDSSSNKLEKLKIQALVLDLVHNIDICRQLQDENVQCKEDWVWDKQLRYYLNNNNTCICRMCDAEIEYTYEYWGNAPKLVHTPLTDKCYITLTQGMHMGFGGSPYGPAGTGKTESVKALGSCFGRQVLVFNCDEGIDFQSMGRIFTGLIKCGAWGCFDEFNRLKEDQLSAVSQQIQIIQAAIKNKTPSIKLIDQQVNVDFNAGIFVTMNPAGKDYGGRSKLPDNLKQLFRPVAMSKPDNNLIAEVILSSEGFKTGNDLGKKMVSLYSLAKQLLSSQQHYDWGLRAMKAVLNTAGKLIQELKASGESESITSESEMEVLIKAIRVNTLSKLTSQDSKSFLGLIKDVFPGAESKDVEYKDLEEAIISVLEAPPFNLHATDAQIRKMMQLKESLDQRMGCVIVGPSGCGKTTIWSVLKAALVKMGVVVKTHIMNPKAMPRERLLGHMDLDTREWTDGVLTNAARIVVKEPLETRSWIICDGDVDPEWIESLNSVLDDNKLLTMPNGERISFGSNVNFIFETHDLGFASPATISRMGMIFLSDDDVDVSRLVNSWIKQQPEALRKDLGLWIEQYFYKALDWVLKQDAFVVDTTLVGTVRGGLSHIDGAESKSEFIIGLIRGLGSNLDTETRTAYANEVIAMTNEPVPTKSALDCYSDRGTLIAYSAKSELEGTVSELQNSSAVIQTVSVQRNFDMVKKWVDKMEPFILVGPEGAGKTMLLNHCFSKENAGKATTVTTLHCNAQTDASHVVQKLRQSCSLFSTNTGRVFRPREGDRLVLFLKDINLPKPDEYRTCMLIAFLQQLITFKGFYDENLEFLGLDRVQIVASMNPATTVGRHHLSTRFTAIVHIAYIDYPDDEELVSVYSTILESCTSSDEKDVGVTKLEISDPKWRNSSNLRNLARTMIEIYSSVKQKFSIDDHRHYLFTTRHLTQWVIGMLRYDTSNENLLDIFAYEAQRLFRDRLIDPESENKFDAILSHALRKDWSHRLELSDVYFTSLLSNSAPITSEAEEKNGGEEEETKPQVQICQLARCGISEFKSIVEHGMMMYEREEQELNLKLFTEILDHVAFVDRVLSRPGGSMLLVGQSGVGRRTATLLTAHMQGLQMFTPKIVSTGSKSDSKVRSGTLKAFFAELKQVLYVTGVDGQGAVLYVEDYHMTQDDQVLESLNSLLSSGQVPGLYKHEELIPLLDPLKESLQAEVGFSGTVFEYFVQRIRANLRVVVSMDNANSKFLLRCESNPALYTHCSILWFGEWRSSSIRELPKLLLPKFFASKDDHCLSDDDEEKEETKEADAQDYSGIDSESLLQASVAIHESCKQSGATPRDFVSFLECFQHLYDLKAGSVKKKVSQFLGGLEKLEAAADTVDVLKKEASKQKVEVKNKQREADESMDEITTALSKASSTRKETETLKEELKEAEEETMKRKAAIEEQLTDITPVLESAKEAVGKIKADHLNELRSLKMPPEPVHDVLSAVLMLLGINDTSWLSMKRFLGNRGVKDEILDFDSSKITPEIRKSVSGLLRKKSSSFEHATIHRVSVAASPFAAWVKANIRYSLVLEKIGPLRQELADAKAQLESSQDRLQDCETELAEIDDRVKQLQDNFKRLTQEATTLTIKLQDTEETVEKAEHLLGQLGGERDRWGVQAEELGKIMNTLPMQILLSAAFVTYLGKSPEDIRKDVLANWISIVTEKSEDQAFNSEEKNGVDLGSSGLQSFDFKRMLSSESEMLIWKSEGLPGDSLSMENAIVILNSPNERCPFIIDPAGAATEWIQCHLEKDKKSPLEVVNQHDPRFVNKVELAVRFGKTLVILEVDRVEPILFPLVRRDFKRQGPRWVVSIGEKVIDYHENFRLFMVTRNPDPELPPDASSLVCEVNFTVTRSGLRGQLLGVTVKHEQPELETRKSELLKQEEDYKVQLSDLEKELLDTLAESEGNLLENQTLLDTLTKTKEKSAQVSISLEESAVASEKLDIERNQYQPFASQGSDLFFTIGSLSKVNHMYRFSLQSFIQIFNGTLDDALENDNIDEKIQLLGTTLEKRILNFCGRGLFKKDRVMFAVHLVHTMKPHLFQENEWEYFVGDIVPDLDSHNQSELPSWAAPDKAPFFGLLYSLFPRLRKELDELNTKPGWKKWGRNPECEKQFPSGISLTPFQRILFVQTLRPDRLQSAMLQFCCDALDVDSVSPPPNFAVCVKEASPTTPVLLITTAGADPSEQLLEHANDTIGHEQYFELALGGGQTDEALRLLRDASRKGHWLFLKNLHLVPTWIPKLEKEFNTLHPHENFRLWLSTEESSKFAPILLQQCLKVTFESPPGVKKNLERTFESWPVSLLEQGDSRNADMRKQMLFLLAWFHALLQERRTYVPQGWSKFYEFSLGDLKSGLGVIELAMQTAKSSDDGNPDWAYVHGLMENSVYGGRIDNSFDLRVLRSYLKKFFNDEMVSGRGNADLSDDLRMPPTDSREGYLDWISQLDDVDSPGLFSLPMNIDRSVQRAQSDATLLALKALSRKDASKGKFDREQWFKTLKPIFDLWGRLTQNGDLLREKDMVEKRSKLDPIDLCISREWEKALQIVSKVHKDIRDIQNVLTGSSLLTPRIQAQALELMQDSIPKEWCKLWEGPESPQIWLRSVISRRIALKEWKDLSSSQLISNPIDLAELFNPGAFINAVRQQTARRQNCSMDNLKLASSWRSDSRLVKEELYVTITGLYIQGACFDGKSVTSPDVDAPELVQAPDCVIAFIPNEEIERFSESGVKVPLYKDTLRENPLLELDIPTDSDEESDMVICCGVALFLA